VNEQLSNELITTPFVEKLKEIMDKKEEEEEKRKEEEERMERESAKRKRSTDSDGDEDDPKGKGKAKANGKGKEKTPLRDDEEDDDDFEKPKHKKRKGEDNGRANGHASALPSSGFSLLSRPDLDPSKHYSHQETEIEEIKVELIDEFMAAETSQGDEFPWRVLNDFTIYDISEDNRYGAVLLLGQVFFVKYLTKTTKQDLFSGGDDSVDRSEEVKRRRAAGVRHSGPVLGRGRRERRLRR
jgi:hypothetical protein